MKPEPKPEAAQQRGPTTPSASLSLHPMRGEGRGEGSVQKALIGAKATHPNAPGRVGTIRSVSDGYAWLEYTTDNEAGQSPTLSPAHYKLTELTIL